jgi:manganese efflux pump family protein
LDLITAFVVAVGLAMDCFAVSLGIGACGPIQDSRSKLRLAFHFGIFQAGMTLLGWLVGSAVAQFVSQVDHWIALALLSYVGINMIRSGLNTDEESYPTDPSRGRYLVMLSVATSIDAMAVGLSMAMLHTPIWVPSLIIGLVSLILSIIGLMAGAKLGEKFGKRMEIVGGLILIAIGIRILVTHLG